MPQGRVKRYERNSGFGFIETPEGDLFVHHTALRGREFLLEGQRVEYQVEPGDRGPRAVNVRVIAEVPEKHKNHPDWRGHRGGTPRFEGQERVLRGRAGRARPRPERSTAAPSTEHIGPPRDEADLAEDADTAEATREE